MLQLTNNIKNIDLPNRLQCPHHAQNLLDSNHNSWEIVQEALVSDDATHFTGFLSSKIGYLVYSDNIGERSPV